MPHSSGELPRPPPSPQAERPVNTFIKARIVKMMYANIKQKESLDMLCGRTPLCTHIDWEFASSCRVEERSRIAYDSAATIASKLYGGTTSTKG